MPKIVSVDPTGWILNSVLGDYYRSVLPLGDTHRPDSELQALMEAAPHEEPRSVSPSAAEKRELRRHIKASWPRGQYPKRARAQWYRGSPYGGSGRRTKDTHLEETVRAALEELDERDRTILELVHGAHMSLRQVEEYTGIPKTTVARRRDEAPKLLAEILKRLMPMLADKYYLD